MRIAFALLMSWLVFLEIEAQPLSDSLNRVLRQATHPSERYVILEKVYQNRQNNPQQALPIAQEMLSQAKQLKGQMKEAESYERLADLYNRSNQPGQAIIQWEAAQKLWHQIGNRKKEGTAILRAAQIEYLLQDYPATTKLADHALRIFSDIKFKDGQAEVYLLMADVALAQRKWFEARKQLENCQKLKEYLFEPKRIAEAYLRQAKTYDDSKSIHLDSILFAHQTAIRIWQEHKDSLSPYRSYAELGLVYQKNNQLDLALKNTEEAIRLVQQFGRAYTEADLHIQAASIHENRKSHILAVSSAHEAVRLGYQSGNMHAVQEGYKHLHSNYSALNQVDESFRNLKRYAELKDSLLKAQNHQRVSQLKIRYQTDKQLNEIALNKVDQQLNIARAEQQSTVQKALIGLAVVLSLLAFTFFNRYRYNKHISKLLQAQSERINQQNSQITQATDQIRQNLVEVQEQKSSIEAKKAEIDAGLAYALRIQQSILPEKERFLQYLPQYFVYYQPKDVVSGDFYFLETKGKVRYVAAVDCSGHGVPGAFMSVLGYQILTEILNESETDFLSPDILIAEADQRLRSLLHQDEGNNSKDSMDVALCAFDPDQQKLYFCGAHRPLYLFQNGTLAEIKGDHYPVGGAQHADKRFTVHEIPVRPGDRCYTFSDGITDQFGIEQGRRRKFSAARLQQFITDHQKLKLYEQGEVFQSLMKTWMADTKQLDDMLLLAWEVPKKS
jgi:serine phosphatase RsbU (regulator of sigma subunit)